MSVFFFFFVLSVKSGHLKGPDRTELERTRQIGREGDNEPMSFDGLSGVTLSQMNKLTLCLN